MTLDQWETAFGDQLPSFMEEAIRESQYVLIVCTPNYKERSEGRKGGVGYEGDIMTAEIMAEKNHRKFIPVLRSGTWEERGGLVCQNSAARFGKWNRAAVR